MSPINELAILTIEETYQADRAATARGLSGSDLMANAGRAVAETVQRRWQPDSLPGHVAVLCGPGNNGGDGFVAARLLAEAGWRVRLALLGDRSGLQPDAAHHAELWRQEAEPLSEEVLLGAGLIIDALFGAGLTRPLEGEAAEVIRSAREAQLPVLAVDLPSGLQGDTGAPLGDSLLPADVTVTFFRPKPGHFLLPGRRLCGEVIVADIGTPEEVLAEIAADTFRNAPSLWLPLWRSRKPESHKYDFGHALIIGGSVMTGAARLAARAALRVGAGLVSLAVSPDVLPVYQQTCDSLIVLPGADPQSLETRLQDDRVNALLLGPGLGVGKRTRACAETFLKAGRALVLDADALTSFAEAPEQFFGWLHEDCILTPHDGEFARLFPDLRGDRLTRARAAAVRSGAHVLLKGADTVVAAPDGRAALLDKAPPWLATAGSGDVLSGLIAGLLAQHLPPFEAACAGTWLLAAAAQECGIGLISDDLPEALPAVQARLRSGGEAGTADS